MSCYCCCFIICFYIISLQGQQAMVRQLTNNGMPSSVCFHRNWIPDVNLCGWLGSKHQLTNSCRNHHSVLLWQCWTLYLQLWRGCKCLITKTTNSPDWSCRCRYFVDATTLSTVKTVTKMMKMTEEKKLCAQRMVVAIFPGQNNGWM